MYIPQHHPVTFVSLGPGDPELITLKALRKIEQCEMVLCPSTTMQKRVVSRAMDILLALGTPREKIVLFEVPMSKDRSMALAYYLREAQNIKRLFHDGKMVAVAAEGDSGFYSSIHYINDMLSAMHVPTARIAGVPAFIACGALANIQVAKQEEKFTVIPGLATIKELALKITQKEPFAIMKPSLCEAVLKQLMVDFPHVRFHYFENVGVEGKSFYSIDKTEIIARKFPYFSLFIVSC